MRDFSGLDPISLRAFWFAAQCENFTEAAKRAGLTQSGVSQHVSRLEFELGIKLFFRNGKTVLITPAGKRLVRFIESYADQVDQLRSELDNQQRNLRGSVSYSMPNSCLMTSHFQLLLDRRSAFPEIDIQVTIAHSEEVIQRLLDGTSDFGFVTKQRVHPSLQYQEFAREEYVLVGKASSETSVLSQKEAKTSLSEKPFVKYPGMDVLFENWRQVYFPKLAISAEELHYRGDINNLPGAITMVKNGVGLSVFPKHCVHQELDSGALISYPQCHQKCFHAFPIWIVRRNDVPQSARVKRIFETFWEMVKK